MALSAYISTSTTSNSITATISWYGGSSNTVMWGLSCNGDTRQGSNSYGSATVTFYGLQPSRTYVIYGIVQGDGEQDETSTSATTDSPPVVIYPTTPTLSSVTWNEDLESIEIYYAVGDNTTHLKIQMESPAGSGWFPYGNYHPLNYPIRIPINSQDARNLVHNIKIAGYNSYYSTESNYTSSKSVFVPPKNVRPQNWNWSFNIVSGGNIHSYDNVNQYAYILPATEWNNFTTRINEFRRYKLLSNYSFTYVTRNMDFKATYVNECINAINEMNGNINNISKGQDIPAYIFNNMKNNLNSIY